jgi:hypothetical protein
MKKLKVLLVAAILLSFSVGSAFKVEAAPARARVAAPPAVRRARKKPHKRRHKHHRHTHHRKVTITIPLSEQQGGKA